MGAWPTRYKIVTDASERLTYLHHKFTTASRTLFKMMLDLTTHCGYHGEFEAKAERKLEEDNSRTLVDHWLPRQQARWSPCKQWDPGRFSREQIFIASGQGWI
ncbi:hypothetical protein MTR_6g033500 [Medicago truncatula]|uniref:Uncharacterized protein n=1 Tax=Medicago truncatula TaxID=3880 RepID=A0A072UIP2_MEDTR|nr:hypothetical protein MTR_6g033500 [Medicago truncatula]